MCRFGLPIILSTFIHQQHYNFNYYSSFNFKLCNLESISLFEVIYSPYLIVNHGYQNVVND